MPPTEPAQRGTPSFGHGSTSRPRRRAAGVDPPRVCHLAFRCTDEAALFGELHHLRPTAALVRDDAHARSLAPRIFLVALAGPPRRLQPHGPPERSMRRGRRPRRRPPGAARHGLPATARPVRAARTTWPWNCSRCKAVLVRAVHIPYRGAAPALTDLAAWASSRHDGGPLLAHTIKVQARACWRRPTHPPVSASDVSSPLPNWASRAWKPRPRWALLPSPTRRPTPSRPCKRWPRPSSNRPSAKS